MAESQQPIPQQPPPPSDDGRWIMSFIDFAPDQTAPGGLMSAPTYEPFSTVIIKANQWLSQNPTVKVKVCETIETNAVRMGTEIVIKGPMSGNGVGAERTANSDSSFLFESAKTITCYVICLRLWIMPKGPGDNPAPQQIGCINMIPECLTEGGLMSMPVYEGYGETVQKLNNFLKEHPLPGHIINVETKDLKDDHWAALGHTERTFLVTSPNRATCYMNIIRLFYAVGPPCHEQIGSVDFVPGRLAEGGMMTMGAFEPLRVVAGRANEWMSQNPGTPVVNTQTIDYKLSSHWGGGDLNTQQTVYYESSRMRSFYVKIIRLYYATSSTGSFQRPPISCLSYKSFVPCQLTQWPFPSFESQAKTMERAMAWLKLTNPKVIGCETEPVRINSTMVNSENTYYANSGKYQDNFLLVLRVYLDGVYQEPPLHLLPPQPQVTAAQVECVMCNIL